LEADCKEAANINGGAMKSRVERSLREIYDLLWSAYGPQHWWPARTETEVVVGAILTQNTAWSNVERAIANLRRERCLSWRALRSIPERRLAALIRSSGTYRIKAARLKAFVGYLWENHRGSLASLADGDVDVARDRLLGIRGIGPETADAILLYAVGRATFVVDAYTKRVLRRHLLTDPDADYETVRSLCHRALRPDVQLFNEYHALLVAVGKRHCRARACCEGCPLATMPHDAWL
jgi:endonuclease-3 related protein